MNTENDGRLLGHATTMSTAPGTRPASMSNNSKTSEQLVPSSAPASFEVHNRSSLAVPADACVLLLAVVPQFLVLGVVLALLYIACRADRALATHGNSCLAGCLCKGHQVRLPAKRRSWVSDNVRTRWSIFSKSYTTGSNGTLAERRPLLPRPVDVPINATPPIAYENF